MSDNAQGLITPPAGYGPPNPSLENLLGAGVTLGSTVDGVTTGYKWTVGGEKFDRYEVNTTNASTGTVIAYDEAELSKPIPRRWIWRVPNAATTVIGEADVKAGTSLTDVGKATVSKTVKVEEPTAASLTVASKINGGIYALTNETVTTVLVPNGSPVWIFGSGIWSSSATILVPGIEFKGLATTQSMYIAGTDVGKITYVQLATPNRTWTFISGPPQVQSQPKGLDNTYPYYVSSFSGAMQSNTRYYNPETYSHPANGTIPKDSFNMNRFASDSPFHRIDNSINATSADDSFEMYMMYLPPKKGTMDNDWVSIRRIDWTWKGNATRTGTNWNTYTPVSPSIVTPGNASEYYIHPTWTSIAVN
jgi:hypothetical protein